jgi:hypothetical protein
MFSFILSRKINSREKAWLFSLFMPAALFVNRDCLQICTSAASYVALNAIKRPTILIAWASRGPLMISYAFIAEPSLLASVGVNRQKLFGQATALRVLDVVSIFARDQQN